MQNASGEITVVMVEDDVNACREMEDFFATLPDMSIVLTTGSASEALEYIRTHRTDAVILDLELHTGEGSGVSFMSGLKALALNPPPYVAVTTNNSSQTTYAAMRQLGADYIFYKHKVDYSPKNVADTLLPMALARREERPLPEEDGNDLRRRIYATLDNLHISPKLMGYDYLTEGIELCVEGQKRHIAELIGQRHQKTAASVERAMQNALNKAWRQMDMDTLLANYKGHLEPNQKAPTVTEFVTTCAREFQKK